MLHQLQVTIDLHKSKLYVSTKQKFSEDINFFASKVDKRKKSKKKVNGNFTKKTKKKVHNPWRRQYWLFLAFGSRQERMI